MAMQILNSEMLEIDYFVLNDKEFFKAKPTILELPLFTKNIFLVLLHNRTFLKKKKKTDF